MVKLADATKQAQNEIEELKSQVADLLAQIKEKGGDQAEATFETISKELADYKQIALNKAQDLQNLGNDGLEQATDYVKKNPAMSIAIAFGAGYVLSRLFSSNK